MRRGIPRRMHFLGEIEDHNERERQKGNADSQMPIVGEIAGPIVMPTPGQESVDPNAKIEELHHEKIPVEDRLPKVTLADDPLRFLVKGNCIEIMARRLMEYPEDKRGYWWDATYIESFDITIVHLLYSKVLHNTRIESLFKDLEFTFVDYEQCKSVTIDDLEFLDQEFGTMTSSHQFARG